MYQSIKSALSTWNASVGERQKLQHSYLVLTSIAIITAGIVSLVDAETGHSLLRIALFTGLAYLSNGVIWNLLQSVVLEKLPKQTRRK